MKCELFRAKSFKLALRKRVISPTVLLNAKYMKVYTRKGDGGETSLIGGTALKSIMCVLKRTERWMS